ARLTIGEVFRMSSWKSLAAVGFLTLVSPALCAAPVPSPPPPPIRLTISLDRQSYLPREPIWVEWSLTNAEPRLLKRRPVFADYELEFDCVDEERQKGAVGHWGPGADFDTPEYIPLAEGQWIRGWLNLRDGRVGLYGTGKFKLRGCCRTVYDYGDPLKREF